MPTVRQTLQLLDGPHLPLARGIAQGNYVAWIGSGVSRQRVDDLRAALTRLLEFLRNKITPGATCRFRTALNRILLLALNQGEVDGMDLAQPAASWPLLPRILDQLPEKYSRVLDVMVEGEADDYLLWDGIDVRSTYADASSEPDAEHLCIAVLVLEGVITQIVSSNWDGLIEKAFERLLAGAHLRVCVRSDDFRMPPLRADLLKFHGCAVLAKNDPATYRPYLIARHSQIVGWKNVPQSAVMKGQLIGLAATHRTLMVGLSSQDIDIQQIFDDAQNQMPWAWPSSPLALVFAEEFALGEFQETLLRLVYRGDFNPNAAEIRNASRVEAFAKPLLGALLLWVWCTKLQLLVAVALRAKFAAGDIETLNAALASLRDRVSDTFDSGFMAATENAIQTMGHALAILHSGSFAASYRPLTSVSAQLIPADAGIATSGVLQFAVALALLEHGEHAGVWRLVRQGVAIADGTIILEDGLGTQRRVFLVSSSEVCLRLQIAGGFAWSDPDVIVVHSSAVAVPRKRSPRAVIGRTGSLHAREVNLQALIDDATGLADLARRFREEAAV